MTFAMCTAARRCSVAKIIMIDDELGWLSLCRKRLQGLGHKVLAVRDWLKALRMVWFHEPDVIVLDIQMPRSGASLLSILRRHWPGVPVIMHSVYSKYRDDPAFAEADEFATKCIDCRDLADKIDEVLRPSGRKTSIAQLAG
jgi:DNA-binding response OmpR family regulator